MFTLSFASLTKLVSSLRKVNFCHRIKYIMDVKVYSLWVNNLTGKVEVYFAH